MHLCSLKIWWNMNMTYHVRGQSTHDVTTFFPQIFDRSLPCVTTFFIIICALFPQYLSPPSPPKEWRRHMWMIPNVASLFFCSHELITKAGAKWNAKSRRKKTSIMKISTLTSWKKLFSWERKVAANDIFCSSWCLT